MKKSLGMQKYTVHIPKVYALHIAHPQCVCTTQYTLPMWMHYTVHTPNVYALHSTHSLCLYTTDNIWWIIRHLLECAVLTKLLLVYATHVIKETTDNAKTHTSQYTFPGVCTTDNAKTHSTYSQVYAL